MVSNIERDLTDLENRLVSDLWTLQNNGEQATDNFATAAETYVRSMMDDAKRRKRLLTDYVEFKETRQETDQANKIPIPYIVVLLDGNCVCFKDDFLRGNGDGGERAARCLKAAVIKYISNITTAPKNSRIFVRIYADLQALSFSAEKIGLISRRDEPRALAPFAFRFSQVSPFFDFIDVGDKNFVNIKILENFKVFSDDPQCKLLLFGVGTSSAYLDMLSSYRGQDKVVMLSTGSLNGAFRDLGLKAVQFDEVFRLTCLSYQFPGIPNEGNTTPSTMNTTVFQSDGTRVKQSPEFCYEFRTRGVCTKRRCLFNHTPITKAPSNFSISLKKFKPASNTYNLPDSEKPGLIPVNATNDRIDIWMLPPTKNEWAIYQNRAKVKKPCNAHYMRDDCDNDYCEFDHKPLPPAGYYCLEFIHKEMPCKKEGRCRILDCQNGHICQRSKCSTSRSKGCKMPDRAHEVDRKVTQWVKPGGASNQNKSESMSTKGFATVKKSHTFSDPCSASAGILSDLCSSNWGNNNLPQPVSTRGWNECNWIFDSKALDPGLVEEWKNAGYNPPDVPKWEIPTPAQAKESTKASQPCDKSPWSLEPRPVRSVPKKPSGYTIGEWPIGHWETTMNQNQNKQSENVLVKKYVQTKEIFNMDYPLIDLSGE